MLSREKSKRPNPRMQPTRLLAREFEVVYSEVGSVSRPGGVSTARLIRMTLGRGPVEAQI